MLDREIDKYLSIKQTDRAYYDLPLVAEHNTPRLMDVVGEYSL